MQSIAIPAHLALELRPEGGDIGSLERAVSAGLALAEQRLWQALLGALEASLPVPRGHVGCGGIVKANGRARRHLVTLAGEVTLSRRRDRCLACGGEVVPLDEALGLEPRAQHTLGVRERSLWLVTELSYAKTARTLEELRHLPVSHGQLHRWVRQEGGRIGGPSRFCQSASGLSGIGGQVGDDGRWEGRARITSSVMMTAARPPMSPPSSDSSSARPSIIG